MNLRKLSLREKRLLFSTIAVLSFFVSYTLLLEPAIRRLREINQEIVLKEANLQRALLMIEKKKEIRNQYEKYAKHIQMKGSEEEEMTKLLKDIETLSAGLVSFTSVKPRSVRGLDFYKQFVVEAECKTEIKALTKFIYQLEHSNKMLKLIRLRINAKEGGSAPLTASMLISKILIPQE